MTHTYKLDGNSKVIQIWRGFAVADVVGYGWEPNSDSLIESDAEVFPGYSYDAQSGTFSSPPPLPPSVDDVRKYASEMMQALVGARDEGHLAIIQAKAHEEAIALLDKRSDGGTLTAEEQARVVELRQVRALFQAIRDASNIVDALDPIPSDFKTHPAWPTLPT